MALHNLNINLNLILFADDTSVSISEQVIRLYAKV